jgi:hypothetical protein
MLFSTGDPRSQQLIPNIIQVFKNLVAPALPQAIFGTKNAHLKVGVSLLFSSEAGERT